MKTKLIAPLFLLAMFAQGCIIVDDDDNTLTVYNESSYVIDFLYITEVDTFDWGPNVLGGSALFPGDSITVDVGCDTYDIKVVDETGVECELYNVDVCFGEDDGWVVDDFTLDTCAFGVNATGSENQNAHGHNIEAAPANSSESQSVTL
jgi:hypothetical protein